ncbi:MAG: DUF899 domain-containing protein [Janthinobacterium lividum]
MIQNELAQPKIATRDEWLVKRKILLSHEKELTKHQDRISAERRKLPMVKIEKNYVFEGPDGKDSFIDLFDARRQLIVYHFMFDPKWDKGCTGCTGYVDALGNLSMLRDRDTHFVLVSRAPLVKLQAYQASRGWGFPWYSSYGSDFNYDFHVTHDEGVAPIEYNYRNNAERQQKGETNLAAGEEHGLSVFFRSDDEIYHTYSTFARGTEALTDAYMLLDTTPYGRQEDWEDSPPGWPQKPTYG